MPYNGSGVFTRIYSWANDAASGIRIRADRMDNEDNGFAQGLSTCITRDGQSTITADLPMSGYKHLNVDDASQRNEYASYGQLQDGVVNWAVAGGTVNAITAAYNPPVTALVDGQLFYVRATGANTIVNPTFSPDGLTAQVIYKVGGQPLIFGDIYGAGHELVLKYRASPARYELLNPAAIPPTFFTYTARVVSGMITSNNAIDSVNDIDISAGYAADSSGNVFVSPSVMVKRLDAAWAAGTNQGGLFTGSKTANTTYHIIAIRNDTTRVVDFGFDTSVTGANKPSGWTVVCRIASLYTDAANAIVQYKQRGDTFMLNVPPSGINHLNNTTPVVIGLKVPTGLGFEGIFQALGNPAGGVTNASGSFYAADQSAPASLTDVVTANTGSFEYKTSTELRRVTDVNGNLFYVASLTSGAGVNVVTKGWVDTRGNER